MTCPKKPSKQSKPKPEPEHHRQQGHRQTKRPLLVYLEQLTNHVETEVAKILEKN